MKRYILVTISQAEIAEFNDFEEVVKYVNSVTFHSFIDIRVYRLVDKFSLCIGVSSHGVFTYHFSHDLLDETL